MNIAMDYDCYPHQIAALIRQNTQPGDKLIILKGDPEWPSELLFLADRKGLFVPTLKAKPGGPTDKGLLDLLENPPDLERLKSLGYNKLVLVSESPVRFAVEASKPGSHASRLLYQASLSPEIDAWPVVYRSQDLLIKKIPGVNLH